MGYLDVLAEKQKKQGPQIPQEALKEKGQGLGMPPFDVVRAQREMDKVSLWFKERPGRVSIKAEHEKEWERLVELEIWLNEALKAGQKADSTTREFLDRLGQYKRLWYRFLLQENINIGETLGE
jgi:hypothetical protein